MVQAFVPAKDLCKFMAEGQWVKITEHEIKSGSLPIGTAVRKILLPGVEIENLNSKPHLLNNIFQYYYVIL